MSKKKCTFN